MDNGPIQISRFDEIDTRLFYLDVPSWRCFCGKLLSDHELERLPHFITLKCPKQKTKDAV